MYEYKSLKERMEEVDNDFIDALFDSPLFDNGYKNDEKNIVDIQIDEDIIDILPF